ncbi:MAG: polysaccharide biosynthesis/export family protein [Candidatus Kryptoniota bacterium]
MGSLKSDSVVVEPVISDDMIRPGDQVQVMVWGYPEFNTTTTVKDYGTITIPLVGDVIAAGFTEKQFAEQVKERLAEYVKGDARVTISHIGMDKRVSVMGAVTTQGNYPVMNSVSLVEIIAAAGGASADADLRHVKIFKHGQRSDATEVDLSDYLESGSFQNVPKVGPGDTIFVPRQENIVREISTFGQDILVLFGFFTILR